MTKVVCVGIAVLDLVFRIDRFPSTEGKYRATERQEVGGGVAANAAATVAALGGDAALLTCLGDDAVGDRIVADLEDHGVDTVGIRRVREQQSPLSTVMVDGAGDRMIVNHASPDLFEVGPPPTPHELLDADAVLVDMRWTVGASAGLALARQCGVPGVLDCDHDPSGRTGILEAASHAVFALPTLAELVELDDPAKALSAARRYTEGQLVVTAGGDGVYWLDGDEVRHLPADEVTVVDTLGAGDVFHGALALALAEGRPLADGLRWASAAAAIKCTRFGGRAGIPNRAEVDEFVARRRLSRP